MKRKKEKKKKRFCPTTESPPSFESSREFVASKLANAFDLVAVQGSTAGRGRVKDRFSVPPNQSTLASGHSSLPVSPSCAQHALRPLHMLKIPFPPFNNSR